MTLRTQSDAIEVVVDDGDVATHNGKNIQEYKGKYNNNSSKDDEAENKNGRKSCIHNVVAKKTRVEKEETCETPRTCAETTATMTMTTKETQTNRIVAV